MKSLLFSLFLALITWIIPDLEISVRIIISLSISLLCCLFKYFTQWVIHKKLKKEYDTMKESRDALAGLYDERISLILRYRQAIHNFDKLLSVAIIVSEEDKIKKIYDAFLQNCNMIDDRTDRDK